MVQYLLPKTLVKITMQKNDESINVTDIECVNLVSENKDSFEDTREIVLPDVQNSFPYLLRKYDGSKIIINKELFKIGKEERYADYRIIDNAAVSRMHAEINVTMVYILLPTRIP